MMHFLQFQLVFVAFVSTLVHALPTSLLASSDLLASGQAAQALNVQFQGLTTNSPCSNLTTACVSNSIATCDNDTWNISTTCSQSQSCFALPNVRNGGTNLTCTSQKNALSVIESTGATGGITGSDSTSSSAGGINSTTATAKNSASITSESPAATATATGSDSRDRITVTVTLTQPVDISTRTISPQEASSIIASIIAEGEATASSQDSEAESTPCPKMKGMIHKKGTSVPTPTPASASATDDLATAGASPASTITLIAATPSATPTTAVTAASDSSSGDSYSGY